MNKITVFDTTLRDGEQAPGYAMTRQGKIAVARKLEEMSVDIIEAGYAISSAEESAAIRDISRLIRKPIICSLSLSREDSIEAAAKALEAAERSRIHLYLGSSPKHREARKMSKQQYIDMAVAAVRKAKHYFTDIQFSAEDGCRTEEEFLVEIANAMYREGARTFNIPDTVGCMTPDKMEALFRHMYESILEVREGKYILSAHTHNDKGMAMINGLYAIKGGARQIEGTMLGIGERAGNMATEQGIMAIVYDGQNFGGPHGVPDVSHIHTRAIFSTCVETAAQTHHSIPDNQPYVGRNVYSTESGTHVNLILKDPTTYYVTDSDAVGRGKDEISIGSKSGRDAVFHALGQLGYDIPAPDRDRFFTKFKEYADGKRNEGGTVSPRELHELVCQFFRAAYNMMHS